MDHKEKYNNSLCKVIEEATIGCLQVAAHYTYGGHAALNISCEHSPTLDYNPHTKRYWLYIPSGNLAQWEALAEFCLDVVDKMYIGMEEE
jgi:hypothetical protein